MNTHYHLAIHQIEAADLPDGVYRTARRLLDLAVDHDGYIEITPTVALAICRTDSPNTMRSHLNQLRRAEVISCQISNKHGRVMIRFTAYPLPVVEEWPRPEGARTPTNLIAGRSNLIAERSDLIAGRSNFEDLDDDEIDEPYNRALGDQIRAPRDQIRACSDQIRALGDQNGLPELEGLEGRNIYNITYDQEFLPSGASPNETANREQPPPSSEAPPDIGGLSPEQLRAYNLLTDPDLSPYGGLSPANALKVACRYKFPYVVCQVATWFDSEYGLGALYNRLMKPKAFPPGVPRPEFLASELYRRHYPLDRQTAEQRARMATYAPNSIEPDPVLDALPVPVWD